VLQVWLPASKGKGLEIHGTYTRKQGQIVMELTFINKAMQAMLGFAVQYNKNRYSITKAGTLVLLEDSYAHADPSSCRTALNLLPRF
jgi:hypothetical protein